MIRWAMRLPLPLVLDLAKSPISGCDGEQTGLFWMMQVELTSHSAQCLKTHRIVVQSSDNFLQSIAELTG